MELKTGIKRIKFILVILVVLFTSCKVKYNTLPDLGLGKPKLHQTVKVENLGKGIRFFKVNRGMVSTVDFYTLSSGVVSNTKQVELINQLKALGYYPIVESPSENGPHNEFLGNSVRIGKFKNISATKNVISILKRNNINFSIRYTAEDGKSTSGPFQISILEIDLNVFHGNIISSLGKNKIKGREQTSSMANKHKAIAAANGGFFAWNKKVGIDGEPAGISIINGKLVSEATNGRTVLIIDNNKPKHLYIAHNVRTKITMYLNDKEFNVNGINRTPGKALNCGNSMGSSITKIPIHDFVCSNPNEIIIFNSSFGLKSDRGKGIEFIVDKSNKIIEFDKFRGNKIPKKGYLIQATGTRAVQLATIAKKGVRFSLKTEILSDEGIIKLKKGLYAINGGPTLLKNGQSDLSARYKEGWETQFKNEKVSDKFVDKKDNTLGNDKPIGNRKGFYYGWVVRRNPRTAIGITKNHKVYIVVVYGRQPTISAGASITEMAQLMKNLGAIEAFNLDGGGSSMMIVKGKKTGKSSDKNGERAVGDALLLLPKLTN